jgi:hypothetical protein
MRFTVHAEHNRGPVERGFAAAFDAIPKLGGFAEGAIGRLHRRQQDQGSRKHSAKTAGISGQAASLAALRFQFQGRS